MHRQGISLHLSEECLSSVPKGSIHLQWSIPTPVVSAVIEACSNRSVLVDKACHVIARPTRESSRSQALAPATGKEPDKVSSVQLWELLLGKLEPPAIEAIYHNDTRPGKQTVRGADTHHLIKVTARLVS